MKANPLLIGFLGTAYLAQALVIPFATNQLTRRENKPVHFSASRTTPATNLKGGVSKAANGDNVGDTRLSTTRDLLYMANVTVGGTDYVLQLDTGSSDLWIATSEVPNSRQSDLTYNLTYGLGYAFGHIAQATVSFAGFTIQDQAFLLATDADNPVSSFGAVGILGLGFTSLSSIDHTVNASGADWGRAFLLNTFKAEPQTPNFISFSLQRTDDHSSDIEGVFTIGEYVDGLENVERMPSIPTFPKSNPSRWNVLIDNIYLYGQPLELRSTVKDAPIGKSVALIDSGTSYSYVDPALARALYGNITGATMDSSSGLWTVPCDAEVQVTMRIGGRPFPLHPLDVVSRSISSSTRCIGTFVGQTLSVGKGEFDWLLGVNVLRSMYTVYDFGDFDGQGKMGDPYLKILPLTNATAASVSFHEARGGTANLTISASGVDLGGTSSEVTTNTDKLGENVDKLLGFLPALLGIMAFNSVVLLGLVGCVVFYFLRRRKNKRSSTLAKEYQYQRVRSQYDPKDLPLPLAPPHEPVASTSARASYVPQGAEASRHSAQSSIHSIARRSTQGPPEDEPFIPPQDAEHEGDLTNNTNLSLIVPENATYSPPSGPSVVVSPEEGMDAAELAPLPRPRVPSNASWMTQNNSFGSSTGRPHSLFSVSSNPLLAPGAREPHGRPMSTYDLPLGAPRPRYISDAERSDIRPESTFSTAPLVRPERRRTDGSELTTEQHSEGSHSHHSEGDAMMMTPPRPRFMGNADGPRPYSTMSVDSGTGAAPLRPVSRFIDASGARPMSEAH